MTRPLDDGATLAPGPHGGDGAAVARRLGLDPADLLDLSASLNPLAPDAAAIVRALDDRCIRSYPDAEDATSLLAEAIGVPVDRLLLTNGGAEAIALVAAEHPHGVVPEPAFSLYRHHLASVAAIDADEPGALVWRANPSSPLGELAHPDARAGVWDEAFWPLATGTWTRGDQSGYRVGSLTKLWSCPGLRLGYVIAPGPEEREALARRQPRWAVNGPALAAVPPAAGPDRPAGMAGRHRQPPRGPGGCLADLGLRRTRIGRQLDPRRGCGRLAHPAGTARGPGAGLRQLRDAGHDQGRRP